MDYRASTMYGGYASPQPTPTAVPDHAPGPEPMARTTARGGRGIFGNPTIVLVGIVGVALLLTQLLRLSGGVSVELGG